MAPNSILFATLLLTGVSKWWVVLIAALGAHLLAELQVGIPVSMVLCWFVSNVCEALIGAICVRRLVGEHLTFDRLANVINFIFAAVVAVFLSSFLDSAFVTVNGWGKSTYWELRRARFFSNTVAALTLVPVIVAWASGGISALRLAGRARIEASVPVLLTGLLAITTIVFDSQLGTSGPPALLYLPLPLLLWAALRFGPVGVSTSYTTVAFLVIWGAGHGMGPLGTRSSAENALSVQLFLMFVAPSLLLLAAVLEERRHAEQRLRASEQRFATAFRSSPTSGVSNYHESHGSSETSHPRRRR